MNVNFKNIMTLAKKDVLDRGGVQEEALPFDEVPHTIAGFNQAWLDYARPRNPHDKYPSLDEVVQKIFGNDRGLMVLPLETALSDMDTLLGEDAVKAVRYLMQTIPAIRIHGAEIDDESVTYSLKFLRASNEAYFLGTITKVLNNDSLIGIHFVNAEIFEKYDEVRANLENDDAIAPFARRLYAKALGIRGLASEYFGRDAKPFPEPL